MVPNSYEQQMPINEKSPCDGSNLKSESIFEAKEGEHLMQIHSQGCVDLLIRMW